MYSVPISGSCRIEENNSLLQNKIRDRRSGISFCLSMYISFIHLSNYICKCIHLSVYPSLYLYILSSVYILYLSIHIIHISIKMSIYLYFCLTIYISVYLFIFLSIYSYFCLSIYISIYLFKISIFYLSIYLFLLTIHL